MCTRKERVCRLSREQMTQKRLQQQEVEVQKEERGPQNRGPMLGNLLRTKGSLQLRQEAHRSNPDLTEQLQRQAHLGQQQRLEAPQQTPQVQTGSKRSIRDEPDPLKRSSLPLPGVSNRSLPTGSFEEQADHNPGRQRQQLPDWTERSP